MLFGFDNLRGEGGRERMNAYSQNNRVREKAYELKLINFDFPLLNRDDKYEIPFVGPLLNDCMMVTENTDLQRCFQRALICAKEFFASVSL